MRYSIAGLLLFLLLSTPPYVLALTRVETDRYAFQRINREPSQSSTAIEVQEELRGEIDRLLLRGHLKPGYFSIGIVGGFILFGNPAEQLYVLSETLPYLRVDQQAKVKTLLSTEARSFDPTSIAFEHCQWGWGACNLDGNRREFSSPPTSPDPIRPNIYPGPKVPAETIYMLAAYAENTGDWSFLSATSSPSGERWNRLLSIFSTIPSTPSRYGEISGAIGMIRILEHFQLTSSADYARAHSIVTNGMTSGQDFLSWYKVAQTRFGSLGTHDWNFSPFHYLRQQNALGFLFAPEIGRFLRDYSSEGVRKVVVTNPAADLKGPDAPIEAIWPSWYIHKAPFPNIRPWTGHYGENFMATPDNAWGLFHLHAYPLRSTPTQLVEYLGGPYMVGDLTFIQKLTTTLDRYGQDCWKDIRTNALTCNGPVPTITPTPTAKPSPLTCPGDFNADRVVDIGDYSLLVQNFFITPVRVISTDMNTDGIVDISDYTLFVRRFFQSCP